MTRPAGTYRLKSGEFFYIGSSNNLVRRKHDHQWRLRAGIHPCKNIQREFDKSGVVAFTPLLFFKQGRSESDTDFRERLRAAEQDRINEHIGDEFFENKSIYARFNGTASACLSIAMKKLWEDPEARKVMIERLRKNASNPSAETREKMAHAKRGANNVKSRPVVIKSPDGGKRKFASVSEAATFCGASQQLMDTWLKGTATWPGTGTRAPRPKYAWLVGYSASYE